MQSRFFCALAAIWVAASFFSLAHGATYDTTRDIFMRSGDTTASGFHGSEAQNRLGKYSQDAYLGDFNRTQIRSDIEAILGHSITTAADLGDFTITWYVKTVSGFNTVAAYRPYVVRSSGQNWNEATANQVQADTGSPWHNSSAVNQSNFFGTSRTTNAAFEAWGTAAGSYRAWVLDDAVAFALLTNPDTVGLSFQHDGVTDNNGQAYSREAAVGNRPYLEVLFSPTSTAYTWNKGAAGGDWNAAANWNPASPVPNFNVGSVDTFTTNSGDHVDVGNGETFGGSLSVSAGATLDASSSAFATPSTVSDMTLAGGTIFSSPGGNGLQTQLAGAIDVTAASAIQLGSTNHRFTLSAMLSGSGGLTLTSTAFPGTKDMLVVTADNSGFSGGFTVGLDSILRATHNSALGTGTTTVNSTGAIDIGASVSNPIVVNSGGAVYVNTDGSLGSSTVSASNLTFNADSLIRSAPDGTANGFQRTLNGNIEVAGASRVEVNNPNGILTIGATLSGAGPLTIGSLGGGGTKWVVVSGNNIAFNGGFEVSEGMILRATSANALGTGVTNVNDTGSFDIGAAVTQTINVHTGGQVLVDAGSGFGTSSMSATDLHLLGGKLTSNPGGNGLQRTLSGNVYIDADSSISVGPSTNALLTVSSTLHGTSNLTSGGEAVGFGGQQLVLTNDNSNTYSGSWTINPNTIGASGNNFVVRATHAGAFGSGGIEVNGAATVDVGAGFLMTNDFSGTGTFRVRSSSGGSANGLLTLADAKISPGSGGFGTLTFGDGADTLVLGTPTQPAVMEIELGQAGQADVLAILGDLALANVEMQLSHPGEFDAGPFTIATFTGVQTGFFSNDENGVVSGLTLNNEIFTANVFYQDDSIVLTNVSFVDAALIPEPASLALWSCTALAMIAVGYRRRRRAQAKRIAAPILSHDTAR